MTSSFMERDEEESPEEINLDSVTILKKSAN